ncbi:signal recognition particle-docking protein FtsY [Candidatus Pacearchaeota archaeon]|nr:signal recognition particle-docking protein FtsY [Candidatus Pacearchaeota archaeon]
MFDALRKKFASWIGKTPEKKEKKKSKKDKSPKKEKKEKIPSSKSLKQAAEKIKEEVPVKFDSGKLQYQPDEEKIKDQIEEKPEEEETKQGFFSKLVSRISTSSLTKEQFDEFFMELELTLLENNVALEVVDKIRESLSKSLLNQKMKKSEAEKKVLGSLKESILSTLIEPPDIIKQIQDKKGIYTIIFFGINGSGKTTSIAKLAYKLKNEGISSVLVAGDTFRAASIEQLQTHGQKLGIPVIAQTYGSDPAAVAFDAKKYAEKNNIKVVLIDTAGRMYTKANLMKEMEKIIKISQPDLKIFVGESITGNDAVDQAKTFNESIGIDGIILSKADVDEKAGTILSVSQVTQKPIYFLGFGQKYEDLKPFTKKEVLKHLGLE